MNVPRFQLALNSDDPDIVKLGLRQFFAEVVKDNDIEESFSVDGVSSTIPDDFHAVLYPSTPTTTKGLLRAYLDASPQIEEFFILWSVPNRLQDRELVGLHMQCLAAVVFCCATSNAQFARSVVERILGPSHQQALLEQLQLNDTFVTQSTIAVLLSCYRINKNLPDELFGQLMTSLSTKTTLLEAKEGVAESRSAQSVLLFLLLDNQNDPTLGLKVILDDRGFKNLFRDLSKASLRSVRVLLQGLLYSLNHVRVARDFVSKIVSRSALQKISDLSFGSVSSISDMCDSFLLDFARYLASLRAKTVTLNKQAKKHANNSENDFLDALKPMKSSVHQQAQMVILAAYPPYIKKCIQRLKLTSWDPRVSDEYVEILEHLCFLLEETAIDDTLVENLVAPLADTHTKNHNLFRSLAASTVTGMLPEGLGKKELLKMLLHENHQLRCLGSQVVHAVLRRVEKQFNAVLQVDRFNAEIALVEVIGDSLPDFLALYNARTSFFSAIQTVKKTATGSSVETNVSPTQEKEDFDIEINFGGDDAEDAQFGLSAYVESKKSVAASTEEIQEHREKFVFRALDTYFQSLSLWCRIGQVAVIKSKCDFLKLLDELAAVTAESDDQAVCNVQAQTVGPLLDFLEFVSERRLCSWFGTEEDAVKLFNSLLVNEDWKAATKKSPLARVLSLASTVEDQTLQHKASAFKTNLLLRSGLFCSASLTELELAHEIAAWMELCLDSDVALLMDIVLRLAFHFFPQLLKHADAVWTKDEQSRLSVPLQFCLLLASGNLLPFCSSLPHFMQAYVVALCASTPNGVDAAAGKTHEQAVAFFEKFNRGFRANVESVAVRVLNNSLCSSSSFSISSTGVASALSKLNVFFSECRLTDVAEILTRKDFELKNKDSKQNNKQVEEKDSSETSSFSSQFSDCLSQSKAIFATLNKPGSKSAASSIVMDFVRDNWKLLAVKGLEGQKLSHIPAEFFSLIETQARLCLPLNALQQCAQTFFFLNLLHFLNRLLSKSVKSEQDMNKTKSASCLVLADTLSELVLGLVAQTSLPEVAQAILSSPLVSDNVMADNLFGMICRRAVCLLMETFPGSLGAESVTDSVVKAFAVAVPQSDATYAALLSSIAKRSADPAVLRAYVASNLARAVSLDNGGADSIVAVQDPVVRAGEFARFADLEALSTSSPKSVVLRPQLRCSDQCWTFFDLSSLLSAKKAPLVETWTFTAPASVHGLGALAKEFAALYEQSLAELDSDAIALSIRQHAAQCALSELCANALSATVALLQELCTPLAKLWLLCIERDISNNGRAVADDAMLSIAIGQFVSLSGSTTAFHAAFVAVLDFYADHCKSALSQGQASGESGMQRIVELASSTPLLSEESTRQSALSSLDKWVKASLWLHLESCAVVSSLQSLVDKLFGVDCEAPLALPPMESSVNPLKMLRLIIAHQSLPQVVARESATEQSEEDDHPAAARTDVPALLRLILTLVSTVSRFSFDAKPLQATLHKVQQQLFLHYHGTMSESDRVIFRILSLLYNRHRVGVPLYRAKPVLATAARAADVWLFDFVKPATVHNTIMHFPLWRSLSTQAFAWEKDAMQGQLEFRSRQVAVKAKLCQDAQHAEENHLDDAFAHTDWLLDDCAVQRYDVAFLLPVIVHTLKSRYVAIRQLTNCGATSMVLLSLCSQCPLVRTYALAALALIWTRIHEQDAEREPNFRERPQIVQLLSFVRNAIDASAASNRKSGDAKEGLRSIAQLSVDGEPLRLPATTAMFLARAALHLMQPKHELYLTTNLYLIGRPLCDARDVPLFDLLVLNADAENEQSERLSVLRMIRDGLRSPQDHLNLCRKHAYSKFLLLFSALSTDHRAGHVVFDILDIAASHRESARYLFEKCGLVAWIERFFATKRNSSGGVSVSPFSEESAAFGLRAVGLLRRLLAACLLLHSENIESAQGECFAAVNVLLSASLQSVAWLARSTEHLKSIVLTLWDALLICNRGNSSVTRFLDASLLQDFVLTLLRDHGHSLGAALRRSLLVVLAASPGRALRGEWASEIASIVNIAMSCVIDEDRSADRDAVCYCVRHPLESKTTSASSALHLSLASVLVIALDDSQRLMHSHSDRVDYAWRLLENAKLDQKELLPGALGSLFLCRELTGFLFDARSAVALPRESALVWLMFVWSTCFGDIADVRTRSVFVDRALQDAGVSLDMSRIHALLGRDGALPGSDGFALTASLLQWLCGIASNVLSLSGRSRAVSDEHVWQRVVAICAASSSLTFTDDNRKVLLEISALQLRLISTLVSLEQRVVFQPPEETVTTCGALLPPLHQLESLVKTESLRRNALLPVPHEAKTVAESENVVDLTVDDVLPLRKKRARPEKTTSNTHTDEAGEPLLFVKRRLWQPLTRRMLRYKF